jgi:putative SOS response-associated peptidase YedK
MRCWPWPACGRCGRTETGLWVPSAAVVTTEANRLMSTIHDRMPVLLPHEAWDDWLDPGVDDREYLQSLLQPAPDDVLAMYPISTQVNNVRHQGPELVRPLDETEEVAEPTLQLGD